MTDIFDGLTEQQITRMTPTDHQLVIEGIITAQIIKEAEDYFEQNGNYITSQHELVSCLYDINLLPEQILADVNYGLTKVSLIGHRNLKRLMFIVDLWKNQKEV